MKYIVFLLGALFLLIHSDLSYGVGEQDFSLEDVEERAPSSPTPSSTYTNSSGSDDVESILHESDISVEDPEYSHQTESDSDDDQSETSSLLRRKVIPTAHHADYGNDVDRDEPQLFTYLNQTIFGIEDSWVYKGIGCLGGATAAQGMVPMILYVLLSLIPVPVDSWIDYTTIALLATYLVPPAIAQLAEIVEDIGETGKNLIKKIWGSSTTHPHIPHMYKLKIPLSFLSDSLIHLHALGMANTAILTLRSIENKDYSWFFDTFGGFYSILAYGQNYYFLVPGRNSKMRKIAQHNESYEDKQTRKAVERALEAFSNDLEEKNLDEIERIHHSLTKNESIREKIKILLNSTNPSLLLNEESSRRVLPSQNPSSMPNIKESMANYVAKTVFIFSSMPEYFFYEYGFSEMCRFLGWEEPALRHTISHVCAALLSLGAYFFEEDSIKRYYLGVVEKPLGLITLSSLLMGGLIALSEVYPAWEATFPMDALAPYLKDNVKLNEVLQPLLLIRYPFMACMALRHHARNADWLNEGYEITVNNFNKLREWCYVRLKNSWLNWSPSTDNLRKGRLIKEIRAFNQKLQEEVNNMNAAGVKVIHNNCLKTPNAYLFL